MKIHQVLEKVNDITVAPGFYLQKRILDGRFLLKARSKEEWELPGLMVTVYDTQNPRPTSGYGERAGMGGIARFMFVPKEDGTLRSHLSTVDDRYQRMGIATEVYRFVRSLGNTVEPSTLQTAQGRAMWKAWKDKGIAEASPRRSKRDIFTDTERAVLRNFWQDRRYMQDQGKKYLVYGSRHGVRFETDSLDDAEKYARTIAQQGLNSAAMVVDRVTKMPVVMFDGSEDLSNKTGSRLNEKWSKKYKKSINCNNPRGFSQRAHCAARRKRQAGGKTKSRSISEAQGRPMVYLDMDGVLADFFSEWARMAGVISGSYRDIPPARVDPTLNKMVGTDFFARLPKFRTADALVNMIVQEFGGYSICSSPLRGDHDNSEKNKRLWIQDNLDPQPRDIKITGRKEKYARQMDGTPNILIDDRGTNIAKWEAAGGIGIKYQADEDSLDVVRRGLERAEDILQGRKKLEPQQLVSRDRSQVTDTGSDADK